MRPVIFRDGDGRHTRMFEKQAAELAFADTQAGGESFYIVIAAVDGTLGNEIGDNRPPGQRPRKKGN